MMKKRLDSQLINKNVLQKINKNYLANLFNYTFTTVNTSDEKQQLEEIAELVFYSGWDRISISLFDSKYKIIYRYFKGVSKETQQKLWANPLPPKEIKSIFNSKEYERFRIGNYSRLIYWKNLKQMNIKQYFDHSITSLHNKENEFQAGSEVLIPIKAKSQILGMISVDSPRVPNSFSLENILLLEHIASLAGLNIRYIELVREKDEIVNEMQKLIVDMEENKIRMMNEVLIDSMGSGELFLNYFKVKKEKFANMSPEFLLTSCFFVHN